MTATEIQKREILTEKNNGKCFICGKELGIHRQFAHILGQTKMNYKLYGEFVIDSIFNGEMVCGLICNKKVDIGKNSLAVLEHIIEVYQKERDKKL